MRIRSHDVSERILKGLSGDERLALANMLTVVKQNLLAIKKDVEKG